MTADIESKQLRELREISDDIEVLREQSKPHASFVRGIFHGAGAVLGGVIALALLGFLLGVLGLIPGFDKFESYMGSLVQAFEHRY